MNQLLDAKYLLNEKSLCTHRCERWHHAMYYDF